MSSATGILTIHLLIPHSRSLKDKRKVVKRIKDRISNKFNVSVAETDFVDKWQRAEISVVTVAVDYKIVESRLQKIPNFIEDLIAGEAEIIKQEVKFL
ncbi:MAG: DUF503 domain-containing protein [Planctomycetota bacterium]|jgi:uncharacterized protein YlxP (DUF503 family)